MRRRKDEEQLQKASAVSPSDLLTLLEGEK